MYSPPEDEAVPASYKLKAAYSPVTIPSPQQRSLGQTHNLIDTWQPHTGS